MGSLVDRHVLDRAKLLKAMLPDVLLCINTNAAAFTKVRHSALGDYADSFTVHCESLRGELFDELMAPLRLRNVAPRYAQMIEAFPGKVRFSVPVSRRNLGELPEMRARLIGTGAGDVVFDPLASRCVEDRSLFDSLALAPSQIACGSTLLDYVVVDSDGMVLARCRDFERMEPIGDIARDGFKATLTSIERRRFGELLDGGRHAERVTCTRCFCDTRTPNFPFDQIAARDASATSAPMP